MMPVNKEKIRTNWNLAFFLLGVLAINALGGEAYIALTSFIATEMEFSKVQIGFFTSATYTGWLLFTLPGGWLADRLPAKWVIFFPFLLLGVSLIILAQASSFMTMILALFLMGVCRSPSLPVTDKAVIGGFAMELRGTVMGIKQMGIPLGSALGGAVLPVLASNLGWRSAMEITGIVVIQVTLTVLIFNPIPQRKTCQLEDRHIFFDQLKRIIYLGIVVLILGAVSYTVITFFMLFFMEGLGFSPVKAGSYFALIGIGSIIGRGMWGIASDYFFGGRRQPVLTLIAGSGAISVLFMSFLQPDSSQVVLCLVVVLAGICVMGWSGLAQLLAVEVSGEDKAGIASSYIAAFSIMGVILGPPSLGAIIDSLSSFTIVWQLLAFLNVFATMVLVIAPIEN